MCSRDQEFQTFGSQQWKSNNLQVPKSVLLSFPLHKNMIPHTYILMVNLIKFFRKKIILKMILMQEMIWDDIHLVPFRLHFQNWAYGIYFFKAGNKMNNVAHLPLTLMSAGFYKIVPFQDSKSHLKLVQIPALRETSKICTLLLLFS